MTSQDHQIRTDSKKKSLVQELLSNFYKLLQTKLHVGTMDFFNAVFHHNACIIDLFIILRQYFVDRLKRGVT